MGLSIFTRDSFLQFGLLAKWAKWYTVRNKVIYSNYVIPTYPILCLLNCLLNDKGAFINSLVGWARKYVGGGSKSFRPKKRVGQESSDPHKSFDNQNTHFCPRYVEKSIRLHSKVHLTRARGKTWFILTKNVKKKNLNFFKSFFKKCFRVFWTFGQC